MKTSRLQLLLIPDPLSIAQPHLPHLPPGARDEGVALIAMMLVSVVRGAVPNEDSGEVSHESR